ncbi:MAG: TPM domain-containing protein [Clostridia bacterium]|nr:TPM domain-containing protein [Clostridia bacterium]
MKKLSVIILAVLFIFALSLPAFAEDYRDDVYRFNDFTETFSEDESAKLNDIIDGLIPELKIDLPVYVFDILNDDETFSERANYFYEHNGFGYGADKSGILLAVYLGDQPSFDVFRYGSASTLIDDDEQSAICDEFVSDFNSDAGYFDIIKRYLSNVTAAVEGESFGEDGDSAAVGTTVKLPTVIDNAGVLSSEEEADLRKRVKEINDNYDVNYVILTGKDNQGLSPESFTLNFLKSYGYDSNGQSAIVFYISFEPGDRYWRTTTRNSIYTKFTEDVINDIDDHIEPDMKKGNYYDACLTHISYVEKIVSGKYKKPFDSGPLLIGIIAGVIIGIIAGLIYLSSCKKAMKVVAPVDAHEYLVRDSFNLRDKKVYYLYTTVTKTPKPKSDSSSGGSSYSSSSSGGGYSSGGRSF